MGLVLEAVTLGLAPAELLCLANLPGFGRQGRESFEGLGVSGGIAGQGRQFLLFGRSIAVTGGQPGAESSDGDRVESIGR